MMEKAIAGVLTNSGYALYARLPQHKVRPFVYAVGRRTPLRITEQGKRSTEQGGTAYIYTLARLRPKETMEKVLEQVASAVQVPIAENAENVTATTFPLPPYDAAISKPPGAVINAVGLEVEGFWRYSRAEYSYHIVTDGSVSLKSRAEDGVYWEATGGESKRLKTAGEVRLGPYRHGVIRASQVAEVYPDYVNSSCGLHVHISLASLGLYSFFACQEFHDWLLDGLRYWRAIEERRGAPRYETFWRRIAPRTRRYESEYCFPVYDASNVAQTMYGEGDRYRAINYCYGKHRTIEVRVLNAYRSAAECIRAAREVVRLFRVWGEQYAIPRLLRQYGDSISTNDLSFVEYDPDHRRVLMDEGALALKPKEIVSSVPGCDVCGYHGFRYYDRSCNCAEWCANCQPTRYARQTLKHDQVCWGGRWCCSNTADVPKAMTSTTIIAPVSPNTATVVPCNICGRLLSHHEEGEPSPACPCWLQDGYLRARVVYR